MDAMEMLFGAIMSGGPSERIARDEVNGLVVSTVLTTDMGYETALIDKHNAYPVERYSSRDDAVAGHAKWCDLAQSLAKVAKLGYGDLVQAKDVTLERFTQAHVDSEADSI